MRLMTGCILTSLLACLISSSAAAEPAGPVMVVKLGAVDVQSVRGAAAAIGLIDNAAKSFCQGSDNPREFALYADTLRCRREMVARAVRKLDAPAVTSLYDGNAEVRLAARRF